MLIRNVRLHWMSFEAQAAAFLEESYQFSNTVRGGGTEGRRRAAPDAPLRRHADRMRVFDALDRAVEVKYCSVEICAQD
jgi:hypothetical protein